MERSPASEKEKGDAGGPRERETPGDSEKKDEGKTRGLASLKN